MKKTFKRFARFDMFILRKKRIRPAVFSLILMAFAFVVLLLRKEQSGLPHGTLCLEKGTLLDVFTPKRDDFLKG